MIVIVLFVRRMTRSINVKWEKDALFKVWLKSHKDPKKAHCSACKRDMKAKRSVLALQGHIKNVRQLHDPQLQTLASVRTTDIENKIKGAELKLAGFIAEHIVNVCLS